jgi:hypothetical protein
MKTSILTIAIAISSILGLSQSSIAATRQQDEITTLTEISHISKIEVHGNVELYLTDGTAEQVKVYDRYYSQSAFVQNKNGVLCISSYKAEKLVVWVTVNDLRSLTVYDNAAVKSFGKLSSLDLDVKLYNNASAQLNMDAFNVSLSLNGRSKADIAGSVANANLYYDNSAFLNITNLSAGQMIKKVNYVEKTSADNNSFVTL